jgi:8-hydroxy-5-deazaflavin:NADPH oxidoreductase
MTTAIIGVGKIGSILARNLVHGGERVLLANRDKNKAVQLAGQLGDLASSAEIGDAISEADVIVLAVYFDVMKSLIAQYSEKLVGKIVVDPSNPVGPDGGRLRSGQGGRR